MNTKQKILMSMFGISLLFPVLLSGNELIHKDFKYTPSKQLSKLAGSEYVSNIIDIPIENPEPFIAVGFNAKIIDRNSKIEFYLRVSEDKQKWSDWQLVIEEEHGERDHQRYLAAPSFFDKNNRYIQFKTDNNSNIEEITFGFVSPGKTETATIDERIRQAGSNEVLDAIERPAFVKRKEWGCPQDEFVISRSLTTVTHLIVHHSAGQTTSSDFAAVVLSYWSLHVNTNEWADIGYNWLVDPNGVLYRGRAWKSSTQENVVGAHNSGMNSGTAGICFIGNYVSNIPSQAGLNKLAGISAFLCDKYGIAPLEQSYHSSIGRTNDNITGHGQSGGGTACPGTQMINRMPSIRQLTYAQFDTSYVPPPNPPEHVRVLNGDGSSLIVHCEPVADVQEYIAYISTDGITFTDSISSPTNDITVTGLTENTLYYFKVKVANETSQSSFTKDLYAGVPSSAAHKVLVVDGFDRGTNTTYNYIKKVAYPIKKRGYAFSFALNESIYGDKISLSDYETVIWILGDESTADETFNAIEQDSIEAYLKQGGNLFVSGSEIGWDLDNKGSTADKAFYHNYLKAQYVDDAPGGSSGTYYSCQPMAGSVFDGISDFSFDNGTHGTIDVDWPDAIQALNGANNILKYKNVSTANIAGVSFEGLFPGGTTPGKLIYLGLPLETIYPEANRIEIMREVFDFFDPSTVSINGEHIRPYAFKLYQNYPNPFNPTTTIPFAIPKAANVQIKIYNLRGELVERVFNGALEAGIHTTSWNAMGNASGVYLVSLETEGRMITQKITVLK